MSLSYADLLPGDVLLLQKPWHPILVVQAYPGYVRVVVLDAPCPKPLKWSANPWCLLHHEYTVLRGGRVVQEGTP